MDLLIQVMFQTSALATLWRLIQGAAWLALFSSAIIFTASALVNIGVL